MGLGREHARQVGGTSCPGDDQLQAAVGSRTGVVGQFFRCAVGRHHLAGMGHLKLFEQFGGVFQRGPVGAASHHDSDEGRGREWGHVDTPEAAVTSGRQEREFAAKTARILLTTLPRCNLW